MEEQFYIPRDYELNQIRNHFSIYKGEPIKISGVGGVGKTTLIMLYINKYKNEYSKIINIPFHSLNSQNTLKPFLGSLFENTLNLKDVNNYKVQELLQRQLGNDKALIIFDDFDLYTDKSYQIYLQKELIELNREKPNYHIIISSRNTLPDDTINFTELNLSNFNLEQSLSFLNKLLGANIDNKNLIKLIHRLDGNPLLLNLAFKTFLITDHFETLIHQIEESLSNKFDTLGIEFENGILKPVLLKVEKLNNIIYPNSLLVCTTPYIIVPQVNYYWKKALDDFEKLINSSDTDENHIQRFFEIHQDFLKGVDYKKVISQPILSQTDGNMKPDFLLCPHDRIFGDIFELKLPSHKLISGKKNRIKFSSAVEDAIAQTRHYREFFNSEENRNIVLKRYGLTAYKPKITVLVGKTPEGFPEEKMIDLKNYELRDNIDIITYDDFFGKMKRLVNKNNYH
jgi:GTPase SAR1 family protein